MTLIIPVALMHYSWAWWWSIFKQPVIVYYIPSKDHILLSQGQIFRKRLPTQKGICMRDLVLSFWKQACSILHALYYYVMLWFTSFISEAIGQCHWTWDHSILTFFFSCGTLVANLKCKKSTWVLPVPVRTRMLNKCSLDKQVLKYVDR